MAPVNDSVAQHNGVPENNSEGNASSTTEPHKFTFPSHQLHMVNLAKMCQENKEYTDCVIKVGEEELRAHKLVLGSVSPFLKVVFSEIPSSLPEATILVPGVKQRVVKALLDFFYTGQMTVERQDTSDLQLLIDTLKIDPGLITVDALSKPNDGNINDHIRPLPEESPSKDNNESKDASKEEKIKEDDKSETIKVTETEDEASTSKTLKRKASDNDNDEDESSSAKKSANSHE